ncbi:6-bladed beta-propeller [Vibrio profundum]|uniref:6-bladed beta-propeller n=1 Tax=Vibrio profundum TaxID=2910247 RepID=UPI003D14F1A8
MKRITIIISTIFILASNAFANSPTNVAGNLITYQHVMTIGEEGSGPGQFRYVEDFAISASGHLLVTDALNANVQIFNRKTGEFIHSFVADKDKFEKPEGIAVDDLGNIYVADYSSGYIQKFDKNYHHLQTFSDFGVDPGENMESEFMTIYNNQLYMADAGNNRVDVFGLDGTFKFIIGEDLGLDSPQAAKSSSTGDIYVVDLGNDRIMVFSSDGKLVKEFGVKGKQPGEFDKPVGLAIDGKDNIYISEDHNNRIQVFDKDMNLLAYWGNYGKGKGEFNNLHGLLVDERGYVFAADTGNNRIQVFAPVH